MNRLKKRVVKNIDVESILKEREKEYQKLLDRNLDIYTKTMIYSLLLAMNSELGIGKERANKVINEMNMLINNLSLEELIEKVSRKKLI